MDKFSKWKYAKAMLFTLGEMLLIYTFPLAAMSSAIATFVAPVAVDPILEKVETMLLKPLMAKANILVLVGLVGGGAAITIAEMILGGMLDFVVNFVLFPASVVGFVFALLIGGLAAKKNKELYIRSKYV